MSNGPNLMIEFRSGFWSKQESNGFLALYKFVDGKQIEQMIY